MRGRLLLCVALVCSIAACSTTPRVAPEASAWASSTHWQGRLSVTVHSDPPQLNAAGFDLQGNADAGELQFFSPLGTTLAQLQWQGKQVHLHRGQEPERFASMDALTEQLTGSTLPVAALFDWLQGKTHDAPGWQVDLSALNQGTLVAQRTQPLPAVTLRLKLDP